jgi:drug/metabolite transporter (DMT)-like permease
MPKIPYLGAVFSLLAAVLWAFAVIMFKKSGEKIHPLALNLFKNLLAFVLFIPTILIFEGVFIRHVPVRDSMLLLASGALGIGIGDTLYFHSLNLIGAGLSAIVVCLYSPLIIFFAVIGLGESLSLLQIGGAGLIILAIFVATYERERSAPAKNRAAGILFGILANVANAVSIVIAKRVLERSPLFWTAEVRLLSGIVVLALILAVWPGRKKIIAPLFANERWPATIIGSLTGAYIAMMVWLAGMKFATASVASALNQTSTIFIFIFAGFILKEPVSRKRVAGIILAFIGVFLVSFG